MLFYHFSSQHIDFFIFFDSPRPFLHLNRHWDVPDNGNSEFFINLKENPHLDDAYGGYAVFAYVNAGDDESFAVVDSIAAAILEGRKPLITEITRL